MAEGFMNDGRGQGRWEDDHEIFEWRLKLDTSRERILYDPFWSRRLVGNVSRGFDAISRGLVMVVQGVTSKMQERMGPRM